jgi:peptide/nickel transport system permease protein
MTLRTLLERLLQLIPVLLGISVIVFAMITLTPGDPVEIMLGETQTTPEQIAALRIDMGLDLPAHERFLSFLGNAATGNFGLSFFHRQPIGDVILGRLPATIELTFAAMFLALVTAVPLGVLAAVRQNTNLDRAATVISLLGVSMPGFWFGILLIMLFPIYLGVLPVSGRIGFGSEVPYFTGFLLIDTLAAGQLDSFYDALRHLLLPAITLALPTAAILMRVTRTSMLEVMRQDYITFAEAKGLSRRRVFARHALKNAMMPMVTVAALETGVLLSGNMIVETVFGWPGLGRLVVEAIFHRNYPLVQASVLVYVVTYVFLNFIADLLYTVLNPRVRL